MGLGLSTVLMTDSDGLNDRFSLSIMNIKTLYVDYIVATESFERVILIVAFVINAIDHRPCSVRTLSRIARR